MNCLDTRLLLEPYCDGELQFQDNLRVEEHLSECEECEEQVANLRSLRAAVSRPGLYHAAPAHLLERLQRVRPAVTTPKPRSRHWPAQRWLTAAASIVTAVGMSVMAGTYLTRHDSFSDERMAEAVIADHIRSTQVDHLTDVASSDRHTVKPWFQGKLDFAPQVPDLSDQGFPLTGGRLEVLTDRPIAGLVYHRRLHVINVLTWPGKTDQESPVRAIARKGFHLREWQRAGMSYWVISDLNDEELDKFVRLFRETLAQSHP